MTGVNAGGRREPDVVCFLVKQDVLVQHRRSTEHRTAHAIVIEGQAVRLCAIPVHMHKYSLWGQHHLGVGFQRDGHRRERRQVTFLLKAIANGLGWNMDSGSHALARHTTRGSDARFELGER